ncbi:hypothetical protein GCM10020358_39690 [Amorphoplanes nipponensis]|uniref:Uncharacterized protein n=1 Tax=Actinoplanes nipponensis TaxID=135950 RepID=A0A919JJT9_9ACTN|nr:hypothetical protein [Actinoplanes nipponensis]GIE50993.1 hypothetical protein Ani05nite_45270 [Actinoplanes nipponensis]
MTGPAAQPEPGDIRLGRTGVVEMYDGRQWVPYVRLPADDPGPLVRDVGDEDTAREADPGSDRGPAA